MPTPIEKIFEDVQLHVKFTQASSRSNIVTYDPTEAEPENISTAFGKLSTWFNALVPTGGSSGQFLGWSSDGVAQWVNNPNVDTKVTQQSTSSQKYRPILFGYTEATSPSGLTTTVTNKTFVTSKFYVKPSTGEMFIDGTLQVSNSSYGPLTIKRANDTYHWAGIKFADNDGVFGSIAMGAVDGVLKRYNSDESSSFMILDTGNTSVTTTGTGNAITSLSFSNGVFTADTGNTSFLTEHPTIILSADTTSTPPQLSHGGTFTAITSVTREGNGHVTKINTATYTLPSDQNTDTLMTQTNTTTSADYRVLLSGNANDTTETTTGRKSANLRFNPSSGGLYSFGFLWTDITGQTLDINTLTLSDGKLHSRRFIQKTDGGADNITNIPVAGHPFLLEVDLIRRGSATDYITRQRFTNAANGTYSYVRYCTNGTWGSWTTRKYTDTNTKVTSSANHYTPATASDQDKTASASGATAAWGIDVVKGVTLNTDGKGHVTGISVTPGKIPTNPVPSNNVTGSGTSGYLVKWNGTNTITNGPQLGSSTTTYLRNDGSWATPPNTTYSAGDHLSLSSTTFSIASYCKSITDWNSATTNGWYMGSSVTNAPSTAWWFGRVVAHNNKYCMQEVWQFTASTDGHKVPHKMRMFVNNVWGNWVDVTVGTQVPENAVFTDHITTVTSSGSGNAVTAISADANGALTVTKGSTFSLSTHKHGLLHSDLNQASTNGTTGGWSVIGIDPAVNGYVLKSLRFNQTSPNWLAGDFGSGIAFGGSDTKGVISMRYQLPEITFAGGSHNSSMTEPIWYLKISGTSGSTYNLANFYDTSNPPTASEVGALASTTKYAASSSVGGPALSVSTAGGDVVLGTYNSSSDDSGDIVWKYGNGQEKARLWQDNTYTAKAGPQYRIYKSDGTGLYSGRLPLADGTSASGTWGISITGNASTSTKATQDGDGNTISSTYLRARSSVTTDGGATGWSQIGINQYNNAYPDGVTNKIYSYGAVVSMPAPNARFDLYYNHNSSTAGAIANGLQYRTGWDNDKKAWRMLLDNDNYGSYMTYTSSRSGYASSDTHILQLGYFVTDGLYDNCTILVSSAFWGNQHGSSDIINFQQSNNTDTTSTAIHVTMSRIRIGGSVGRTFYYKADNTNNRVYLYVYVTGGNSYGRWNTTVLQSSGLTTYWRPSMSENQANSDLTEIPYTGRVDYATTATASYVLGRHNAVGLTTTGVQYAVGQITIGSADGNAKEGSNASYKLWSYPAGGTAVSSTAANIQNLRLYWSTAYYRDIFISPNNYDIYHRAVENNNARDWRKILDSGNYTSYTLPRNIKHIHTASGTEGSAGWVKIARITVTAAYANHPMTFTIAQRGVTQYRIHLLFVNNGSAAAAAISEFIIARDNSWTDTNNPRAYIIKPSDGIFDLYIRKTENYDHIFVVDFTKADGSEGDNYSVAWTNVHAADSAITGGTEADKKSYLSTSGGTVSGTLVLSKTQDASGTENNSPALIVGGAATSTHLELDANEIMAKTNGTSTAALYINDAGGNVYINNNLAARHTATPISGQVVITDGTTGGIKSSGSTIVATPSSKVNTNWGTTSDRTTIVTKGWMSYWDGSYDGSASNLTYCNKGAFGTIVTKNTGDYVLSHGNLNGTIGSNSPAADVKTFFMTSSVPTGCSSIGYNTAGNEYTLIFGKGVNTAGYGAVLKFGYDSLYPLMLRIQNGTWKSTDWEKISAGYADIAASVSSGGTSSSWWNDRDTSIVKCTTGDTNYRPLWSLLTASTGSWAMGNHTGDDLIFNFISKAKHDAAVNPATLVQIHFTNTGGITSTGTISAATGVDANAGNSSTAGGLSLYSTNPDQYGVIFRGTSQKGKHGYVTSDWATYFTMNDSTTRGWVFNRNASSPANVASISGAGNAVFNGSVTVGGNAANTSGCRLTYNSSTQSLDFIFA